MNEHERTSPDGADEVVARLRATDPARGAHPDLAALRAAVDARRGPEVTATSEGLVVVDELAARRRPRLTSWPARAAGVAAGILLVGGGGFAIGLGAGTASVADAPADETVEVTILESPEVATGGPQDIMPTEPGDPAVTEIAPEVRMDGGGGVGEGGMGGAGDASMAAPYGYWQHTIFTSTGLSTEGGAAEGLGLDGSGTATAERMAAIATALGMVGEPVDAGGYWSVGPQDGTGPSVGLYPAGDWSINFYDPSVDPWACPQWSETATDEEMSQPCVERDLGPLPSNEEAIARSQEILVSLGLDPAEFTFNIASGSDTNYLYVEGIRTFNGRTLDLRWSFNFTGGGLQSVYGSIADFVSLGEYQIVSPTEAVARFSDPRFSTAWASPFDTVVGSPMRAAMEGGTGVDMAPTPTTPTPPTPGMLFSWPVSGVTITSAELTLASHYQNDGTTTLLVPTYLLYSADGGIWRMIAVADSGLDFSDGR